MAVRKACPQQLEDILKKYLLKNKILCAKNFIAPSGMLKVNYVHGLDIVLGSVPELLIILRTRTQLLPL